MLMSEKQEALDKLLLDSAVAGNVFALEGAIKQGARLTANVNGRTALHLAVLSGKLDCVKFLWEHTTVEKEATDFEEFTALLLAFAFGHEAIADYLVAQKADVLAKDKLGRNIVFLSTYYPDFLAEQWLCRAINAGAERNTCNKAGFSPVHVLLDRGNICSLEKFLLMGADPALRGRNGTYTPLQQAEADNLYAEAALLRTFVNLPNVPKSLEGITQERLTVKDKNSRCLLDNPLLWARTEELVEALRKSGEAMPSKADLLRPGVMEYPPLSLAIYAGKMEVVEGWMAERGEVLTAEDFWNDDHTGPSPFARTAIECGYISKMFTEEEWRGKPRAELRAFYKALPPDVQGAVYNYQSLYARLSKSVTRAQDSKEIEL